MPVDPGRQDRRHCVLDDGSLKAEQSAASTHIGHTDKSTVLRDMRRRRTVHLRIRREHGNKTVRLHGFSAPALNERQKLADRTVSA
jgi:hypothetical protein